MNFIEKLLKDLPSGKHFEKLASGWNFDQVASHVVGFLNSGGGIIVAGDAEGSPGALEKKLKADISPNALFSVTAEIMNDVDMFIIDVPGGKDLPFVFDGSIYLRKAEQTVKADAYDIQDLLQRTAATPLRWERKVSLGLEYEDLNQESLSLLTQEMLLVNREHSSEDTLTHLAFLRSDGQYTNASDVCLAKKPSIRHPQIRVRCFIFEHSTADTYQHETTLEGSISELIQESISLIRQHAPRRSNFTDSAQRTTSLPYPEAAIREALVNALAHRDYANHSGGVTIKLYPNELHIWNSGELPDEWKEKDLWERHPSIPRNPDIAQYLYVTKYMERIGRGTIKMIEACKDANLPTPEWNLDHGIEVIFKLPPSIDSIRKKLNDRQSKLLLNIEQGETITSVDYRANYAPNISQKQASRDLNELSDFDVLIKTGSGRGTKYLRT